MINRKKIYKNRKNNNKNKLYMNNNITKLVAFMLCLKSIPIYFMYVPQILKMV